MTQSTQTPTWRPTEGIADNEATGKLQGVAEPGPLNGGASQRSNAPPDSKFPQSSYIGTSGFADKNATHLNDSMRPVAFSSSAMLNDSVPPAQEYEPLVGGTGKEIYYRQARYSVADLLGKHSDIDHYVEFGSLTGTIIDFGINGLAFSLREGAPAKDNIVEGFRVVIGNDTLYQGRALIRYC